METLRKLGKVEKSGEKWRKMGKIEKSGRN